MKNSKLGEAFIRRESSSFGKYRVAKQIDEYQTSFEFTLPL